MAKHIEWLPWRNALIEDYSEHLSNEMLAVALGVSCQTIITRQKKLGCFKRKKLRITDGHKSYVAAQWGVKTPTEISFDIGIAETSIILIAKEIGLPSQFVLKKAEEK